MESKSIKKKVFSSLIWKFSERISAQLVTFVVSIFLARLLDPAHYGSIAIVNIFITFANVFVDSGFGSALIQKKDADNKDFSSVLYCNVVISALLYALLYWAAPYIALFYKMDVLSPVLRVLGLRIIVAAVNSVQHAYVSKHMLFKKFFWSTLGGTLLSGVVGIVMAYKGYGIWALVAQYMTNTTVDTIVLWFTVKWRPNFVFSIKRIVKLFSFGWKILVSSLIETGYNELRSLIIGRMYTPKDLAYYNKGKSFPNLVVTNVNSSVQSVLFPAMSNKQENKAAVKAMTKRSIRVSSYIMFPIMLCLALVAKPFVSLLLTDKWLSCVPYLQISCVVLAFMPIHTANLQAIKAMGRSDTYLKLEIAKKISGLIILLSVFKYGVMVIAVSTIFATLISSVINAFPNRKLLSYGYFEQIKDLFNGIIPLSFMLVAVYFSGLIPVGNLSKLMIQVLVGMISYIFVSVITKNESFNYILSTVKGFLKKKFGSN